jgi:hypothetical protein
MTPRVSICVPSSRTWCVQRRRRSDQPIWRSSPPSTSLSTRLPPFEHRAAAASPLWAVASPPLVPDASYQRAFSGMYVAGGSPAAAPTPALQPRHPIGPLRRCTRSSPSPREDVAGFHRASSLGAGCRRPRMVFVAPPGSSSPTSSTAAAPPQVTCMALLAVAGPADYLFACPGIQHDHSWSLLVRRLLRLPPARLHRQRHRFVLIHTCSSTLTTADYTDTLCRCAPRNCRGGLLC